MIKVALAGGRGYVGEELLKLLVNIPNYEVVYAGSRSAAGTRVSDSWAGLETDLVFQDLSEASVKSCQADVWVIAQPNGQAEAFEKMLEGTQCKLIDISSDFRFDDHWTYGLPEKNEAAIQSATRIANPGCYATATQLALLPLVDLLAENEVPGVFGISGFSGAGRTANDKNNPQRLANNILPYSLVDHTHEREVSRQIGRDIRFMPHVASFFRGITITVDVRLQNPTSTKILHQIFSDFYSPFPLIQVTEAIPEIQQVASTNKAIIGGFAVDPRHPTRVAIVSVIDNLRKGAASQAIQNMNLMFGLDSKTGLVENKNKTAKGRAE